MNYETFFEIGGYIFVLNTPMTTNNEPVRIIQRYVETIVEHEVDPRPMTIERRWDDTPEKRRAARKRYGWGSAPYSFR